MRGYHVTFLLLATGAAAFACGTSGGSTPLDPDAGSAIDAGQPPSDLDGGVVVLDAAPQPTPDAGPAPLGPSKIEHVVVIVQENHTFDTYFGRYCTAPAGSNPSCNTGPACCEGAPDKDPNGISPTVLDDKQNGKLDPNHSQACELSEMNSGAMDRYTQGAACSNPANFAIAPDVVVQTYLDYAKSYAIADRYFQPIVGQTSSNDMYFAAAKYVFTDNAFEPAATGHGCADPIAATTTYKGQTTSADLVLASGASFADYAMGFDAMYATSLFSCPTPPADCPFGLPTLPCVYDPGDVPFEYYDQFQNNHTFMKDYKDYAKAIAAKNLPNVSFLKAVTYMNEHPGYGDTISSGVAFVSGAVQAVLDSPDYKDNTLILLVWDEGGGFYDHVKPPDTSAVDNQPYGTRVPLVAIGRFAKKNYVSHVEMEHSSIVKFLEWNFTGATGQLGGRDATVNNIGSLIDQTQLITAVPEN
jgi:phospholipase C